MIIHNARLASLMNISKVELNILQSALRRWEGPWMADSVLSEREQAIKQSRLIQAHEMANMIEDELTESMSRESEARDADHE